MLRILAALFVLLGICGQANAQSAPVVLPAGCGTASYSGAPYFTVDSTGKECVNATVNASVGGFVPSLSYGTLTATASTSASTALPTNTGTVAFQNNTAVTVSCTLASGSAVATTNEVLVPAGSTVFLGTTGYDHAACINQTGSASNVIVMAGGTGLGTGFGGGSSGGGGGAITIASGAVASGAYSAGAIAAGAGVDGWDLTQGAKADAKNAATDTTPISIMSVLKQISSSIQAAASSLAGTLTIGLPSGASTAANQTTANTSLATIATNTGAPIPAGTAYIGQASPDPSLGGATPALAFLALPATATTQIIALSGSTVTYVTSRLVLAGGTVNVTFKYGTGTNCGTGTTTLDGPYPLTAQAGFSEGNGGNAVLIVPAGKALCVTTDASVSGGVKLTYQQK